MNIIFSINIIFFSNIIFYLASKCIIFKIIITSIIIRSTIYFIWKNISYSKSSLTNIIFNSTIISKYILSIVINITNNFRSFFSYFIISNLLILIIFIGLSILLNNKSFLEILPGIILLISSYHSRDYSAIYEKYFKQEYSLFKIYLKVCFIPTFLFIIFSEILLRICFNSSLILLLLR